MNDHTKECYRRRRYQHIKVQWCVKVKVKYLLNVTVFTHFIIKIVQKLEKSVIVLISEKFRLSTSIGFVCEFYDDVGYFQTRVEL